MATKLFSEFKSSNGTYYKIEIHDTDYTGTSPDEFNVSGSGFELTYSGETDNIYSPIIGSSVSFGLYVQDVATINFVNNIKQYQQDRYFIKIYKGTTEANATFYWGGYIVQDIIEIEDTAQPFILQIQATDGISKLQNTLCGTSFFRVFTNQFISALDQVGVLGIYEADDPVIAVVCDWWAEEMTYSTSTNPLDDTWVDFHAFDTIDEEGIYTNANWYDILSQMLTIFGLRFYFSNGQYRIEQLFQRTGSFTEHTYKKNMTKIASTTGVNYTKTIDQTRNKARLSGNVFNFLPAVNDVSITLDTEAKAMNGVVWKNGQDPKLEIGLVSSALKNQITFDFFHKIRLTVNSNVNSNNIFAKMRLNVELFDFDNNVTYYLKRRYTGMTPSTPEWTTTQSNSGYEVLIGPTQEFSAQVAFGNSEVFQMTQHTAIVTPIIPASGDMTIDWDFVGFVETNGSVRGLSVLNTSSYKVTLKSVETSFGAIQNQSNRLRAVSPNADINGLVSYELPATAIFTGQGERGSLVKKYDYGLFSIKVAYGNWREGNSGSYLPIQKLICQELLKLMDEPVQMYSGSFFSSHDFRQRLTFDSKNWIQLGGTFDANTDEWTSTEFFVINRASITPTFDDTVISTDVSLFGNVNGTTGGVSFDGIDAVNLDTNILDVTTTANVGTDLDVGGNTDLSGRLDVSGNTILSSTSVGAFTTTNQVNVTINSVSANAGGSETLSLSNNFNFISFSGSDGVYTLNLPNADAGAIMIFKTDDSVSSTRSISLTPQSGQRIEAESTFSLNSNYETVKIVGINDNWFVI